MTLVPTSTPIVPHNLGPGLVPIGFAEEVLERSWEIDDPAALWDGATTAAGLAQKWNGHAREKNELKTAQVYLEVQLGEQLGPRPDPLSHDESGRFLPFSHAKMVPKWVDANGEEHDLIPAPRVSELQRLHGHRDWLIPAIRDGIEVNGKTVHPKSRRSLLLLVDKAEAAERTDLPDPDIIKGDFRDVLDVEPGTVALVLTDPPYPTEYLPLWADLGKFSSSWLVDGGSLVAYCGQSILPDALNMLGDHLRYWWTLALIHSSGSQMMPGKNVSIGWKPLLWFVNNKRRTQTMLPDRISGSPPRKSLNTGDTGDWAQGVEELESIISALTAPGDLIVDPFAGSGTVGLAALRFGREFRGATL